MIREMTKDENEMVSDEAKRYLKELTSDSKKQPIQKGVRQRFVILILT